MFEAKSQKKAYDQVLDRTARFNTMHWHTGDTLFSVFLTVHMHNPCRKCPQAVDIWDQQGQVVWIFLMSLFLSISIFSFLSPLISQSSTWRRDLWGTVAIRLCISDSMMLIICLQATKRGREDRKRETQGAGRKEDGQGMNKSERGSDEKESEKAWSEGGLRGREGTLRSEADRCWHVRLEIEPRDTVTLQAVRQGGERKKERTLQFQRTHTFSQNLILVT